MTIAPSADHKLRTVHGVASEGWANPINRSLSRMTASLYAAGVPTDTIYDALIAFDLEDPS